MGCSCRKKHPESTDDHGTPAILSLHLRERRQMGVPGDENVDVLFPD